MRQRWTAWEMAFATVMYVVLVWLMWLGMNQLATFLGIRKNYSFLALLLTPVAAALFALFIAVVVAIVKRVLKPILPASWYDSLTRERGSERHDHRAGVAPDARQGVLEDTTISRRE